MDTPLPDLPGTAAASNDALGTLSQVIYASESFDEVYQAIVNTAVRIIDGCDHASIMQRGRDGRFQTVASSDDIARAVDKLEQLHREGPCLDAIVEDVPQFENDLADPTTQWPALAEQVVRQTPVRAVAGFRIIAGDQKIGALNLFSDQVNGMGPASADQAIVLAAFASVAVSAVHGKKEARTLAAGLESNREIGKAIGLLMAFHKVSDAAAFDLLRKASQDMNIKLAEVAREVVAHHNTGHPTPKIG
ncbi:MAG TPA: GAF and ANTAR domain-containing protein [Lapillicoccus sp.]|nr:GAF and ANTAR domain-containing protein [Lapillicoccus sp.]